VCCNSYKGIYARPDSSIFLKKMAINFVKLTMPQVEGKANYKVDALIQVVEEKLPKGAQVWQEVAALYQHHSGELVLWDHDDVKQHWFEKCCNKFREPTSDLGDSKRDMILRGQRIQQRILAKTASAIMGADSGGDEGLAVSDEKKESLEEEEVMVAVVEDMAAEEEVAGIGLATNSRNGYTNQFC
jgi:hypothetical protein